MTKQLDFEADGARARTTPADLAAVAKTAKRVVEGQRVVAELEKKLSAAKQLLETLVSVELPDQMLAIGLSSFNLEDGTTVTIKDVVAGSIPKDKLPDALAWLRANGHEGIIKSEIEVAVPKGKDSLGAKAVAALQKLGLEVNRKEYVHSQTLGSWARELVARGTKPPADLFGLFIGKRAKVEVPRG